MMKSLAAPFLTLGLGPTVVLALACGGKLSEGGNQNEVPEPPSASAGAGGTVGAGAGETGGTGGTGGTPGMGGTAGTGGAPVGACGPGLLDCPEGMFCDFPNHDCGVNGDIGSCSADVPYGPGCPSCGCDGVMYLSEYEANWAGVDIGGLCPAPPGTDWCGEHACPIETHFCEIFTPDAWTSYSCTPFAEPCPSPPDCTCIIGASEHPGGPCGQRPSGLITSGSGNTDCGEGSRAD